MWDTNTCPCLRVESTKCERNPPGLRKQLYMLRKSQETDKAQDEPITICENMSVLVQSET